MVNPGAFRGLRKEFLLSQKSEYAKLVRENYVQEAISGIHRRYFKRFPIDIPHDVELTVEHLDSVDDDLADPDTETEGPPVPDVQGSRPRPRSELIKFRKKQIRRWMAYQYMKDTTLNDRESGALNPYAILLRKLTGRDIKRPRLRSAVNVWRQTGTNTKIIEDAFKDALTKTLNARKPIATGKRAALREAIAHDLFKQQSPAEQEQWKVRAQEERDAAQVIYDAELNAETSTEPEERQRAIQALPGFMQPILDLICEATSWKATLITGGPEPAHNGQLNVLSLHSGLTTGAVKMNFVHSERANYKNYVVPIFGCFLKKCYSPEESRSRALSPEDGFQPMATIELPGRENDFDLHAVAAGQSIPRNDSEETPGFTLNVSMPNTLEQQHLITAEENPLPYDLEDDSDAPWHSPYHAPSSPPPSPRTSRPTTPDFPTTLNEPQSNNNIQPSSTITLPLAPLQNVGPSIIHDSAETRANLDNNPPPSSELPLPSPGAYYQRTTLSSSTAPDRQTNNNIQPPSQIPPPAAPLQNIGANVGHEGTRIDLENNSATPLPPRTTTNKSKKRKNNENKKNAQTTEGSKPKKKKSKKDNSGTAPTILKIKIPALSTSTSNAPAVSSTSSQPLTSNATTAVPAVNPATTAALAVNHTTTVPLRRERKKTEKGRLWEQAK